MSLKNLFGSIARSAFMATLAAVSGLLPVGSADAQSHHALRAASEQYRDVVLDFERHINSNRQFSHYDRRVADRLEDASGDFRSAARNPRDIERLLHHWDEVSSAHFLAERLIRGCGHPDPALLACWQPVAETYLCLVEEMRCLNGHGGHASYRIPVDPHAGQWNHGGLNHGGLNHGAPHPGSFHEGRHRFNESFPGHEVDSYGPVHAPVYDPRVRSSRVEPSDGRDMRSPVVVPASPWRNDGRGSVQGLRQPVVEVRPVDPRREVGAAIAVSILNRLLN